MADRITRSLIAFFAMSLLGPARAAPDVGPPMLDTSNDLMDVGGGTPFDCDINGLRNQSGGGPWVVNAGANLYDNNTNTHASTQFTADTQPPALVGVYGLTNDYALTGFAITTHGLWQNGYNIRVQGSTNSTTGYDGDWTDIYVNSAENMTALSPHRYDATNNTVWSMVTNNLPGDGNFKRIPDVNPGARTRYYRLGVTRP